MKCKITTKDWGFVGAEVVQLYTLENEQVSISLTNYGAILVAAMVPDRKGQQVNIVAGFESLLPYTLEHPYMGCIVGRYCNRIAGGHFAIDGQSYQLTLNEGVNHLHGGFNGLDKKVWKEVSVIEDAGQCGLRLHCQSGDGEEGYPGQVEIFVTYLLHMDNKLHMQFQAVTDKPTILNLTNHSYFNLTGFAQETIYDHYLQIEGRYYTEKGATNTPTGRLLPTEGTPLDFSRPQKLGRRIGELKVDMGYDHNFVLSQESTQMAAHLYEEISGRSLKVYTNQPGLQVYTANWWKGELTGQQHKAYQQHGAIALETQGFPDAPNYPHFPSAVLRPGELYERETIFEFGLL